MRIEIENKMSVDQLLARVESSGEPVELTRGGEVVAEVKPASTIKSRRAHAKTRALSDRPTGKHSSKRRVEKEIDVVGSEVPLSAADRRVWAFVDAARNQTAKLGLTNKQVERLVDRAVREVRRKRD